MGGPCFVQGLTFKQQQRVEVRRRSLELQARRSGAPAERRRPQKPLEMEVIIVCDIDLYCIVNHDYLVGKIDSFQALVETSPVFNLNKRDFMWTTSRF